MTRKISGNFGAQAAPNRLIYGTHPKSIWIQTKPSVLLYICNALEASSIAAVPPETGGGAVLSSVAHTSRPDNNTIKKKGCASLDGSESEVGLPLVDAVGFFFFTQSREGCCL